jgi:hypothetical protein
MPHPLVEAEKVNSYPIPALTILTALLSPDGGLVLADDTVWPGVIGSGISMLMGFLGVIVFV